MKRIVAKLVEPKKFDFFEEELPGPRDDEMLVRTTMVGLCHSDLPVYFGTGCTALNHLGYHVMDRNIPYPVAIGHEPVGVVEAVGGNVAGFSAGDTVSGMVHQSFASHFLCTTEAVVNMTAAAARHDGASASGRYGLAEPLLCIANIAEVAAPQFGDRVAVIGCGFMGLLTIMALANANLRQLTAVDIQDGRLELARRYGATSVINPRREALEDRAYSLTGGGMYDVVIEVTGSLRGFDSAMSVIRLADRVGHRGRGRVLIPSLYGKEETWSPATGYNLMLRAPKLYATHPRYCVDLKETMQRGVDMYCKGVLKMDELISHTVPFENLADGFRLMEESPAEYVKGVVVMDSQV